MENFGKTDHTIGKLRKKYVENAYPIIFSNARRAGAVDTKRLIYGLYH